MADDLGWGDVGFNGNDLIQTPHMDSLAAQGIVFERFYSASAVCSPTRGSVLTGRHPMRLGIQTANDGHLREKETTIAELLKDAGYATGHFGKWHLGTLTTTMRDSNRGREGDSTNFSLPSDHGFDTYFSTEAKVPTFDPMIKPVKFDTLRGENLRYGWAAVENESFEPYGTHYWTNPKGPATESLDGDNSRIIMDRVLPFIDRADAAHTPFFSVIWFHTPHLPVVADESWRSKYAHLSHAEQIYYGTISAMDHEIGRLWQHLESKGMDSNTMLWFASDNGPEDRTPGSAGPFRERKRSLYEGGVRVPAFAIWPAHFAAGERRNQPAVTSDYLPTIASYLDIKLSSMLELDGESLGGIIADSQSKRASPIGFKFREKQSWVDGAYKLISTDNGATYELYNLSEDSQEQTNLILKEEARFQQMKTALHIWLDELAIEYAKL